MSNSDIKVVDTFEEDGELPIISNKYQVVDTLNVDGDRPIISKQNIQQLTISTNN